MGLKSLAAALAAALPVALAAQLTGPDAVTIQPAPEAKTPYAPHKATAKKKADKSRAGSGAPRKPSPPTPAGPPRKPSSVPSVIYDRRGNAIPTSPDAYDVSSAKPKR